LDALHERHAPPTSHTHRKIPQKPITAFPARLHIRTSCSDRGPSAYPPAGRAISISIQDRSANFRLPISRLGARPTTQSGSPTYATLRDLHPHFPPLNHSPASNPRRVSPRRPVTLDDDVPQISVTGWQLASKPGGRTLRVELPHAILLMKTGQIEYSTAIIHPLQPEAAGSPCLTQPTSPSAC